MKKIIFLLAFLVMAGSKIYAQASSYAFTATSSTFDTLVGSTVVSSIHADGAISAKLPIGFTFTFDGVAYDSLKASSDGFISFNPTATNTPTNGLNNTTSARSPLVAPLWDDNDGRATGGSQASYMTTGTAPNRVFTFEWKNWEWRWSSSTPTISFQVKLHETSNVVEFVYRQESGTVSSGTASIGISGTSSFLSLDGTGTSPTASSSSETTNLSAKPATGQVYSFTPPSCPAPGALSATNITPTSANLAWTESGSATTWEVEWDTAGFTLGTGNASVTTSNPYALSSLLAETDYEFYVRGACGANDSSAWVGPISFKTLCAAVVAPWTQTFGSSSTIPSCWAQGASNSKSWKFASTGGHVGNAGSIGGTTNSGGHFAYVDDSTPDHLGTALETPLVDVSGLTNPELNFFLISNNEGHSNVTFSIDIWDGAAWNTGFYSRDTNTVNGEWEEISLSLSSLTITGAIQVRFVVDETVSGDFYDDVAIDDIRIWNTPTCPAPKVLTVANITNGAADLGWTEMGSASNWQIEWDTTGFTQGTGTMSMTTTNPHSLSSLSANTDYDFYVRAVCGASDSSVWTGPYSFTTACNAVSSFSENFDGVSAPNMPDCWSNIYYSTSTSAYVRTYNSSSNANSGSNSIRFFNSSDSDPTWMVISPVLSNLNAGTHQTRFFAKDSDGNDIIIGTMSDPNDTATFTAFDTITTTSAYVEYSVSFATYSGSDSYIAYRSVPGATYDYTYMDDISWEIIPNCPKPDTLIAENITTTGADLGWAEMGMASNWQIEWDTAGFTQGTGTKVLTTTNPHALSGLTANTDYEFYVKAICGSNDSSIWVGPYAFSTPCVAASIPFFEGFESGFADQSIVDGCISQESVTGTNSWTANNSLTSYGRGPRTGVFSSYLRYGNEDWMFVAVDLVGGTSYNARIYAKQDGTNTSNAEFTIAYGTTNTVAGMTNTIVGPVGLSNTFAQVKGTFTPATSGVYYIGFKGYINSSPWYITVDDMEVYPTPTCPEPDTLVVNNVTNAVANLGWTEMGSATAWEIEYDTTGFAQGTGTVQSASSNPYSLTGLAATTTYDYYVRAICGANDTSAWAGPYSFTTLCNPVVAPFLEEFGTNSLPTCWMTGGATTWEYGNPTTTPSGPAAYGAASITDHSAGGAGTFIIMDGSDNTNGEVSTLSTPLISLSGLTSPYFTYAVFSNNITDAAQNKLIVELYDGANWNLLDSIQANLGTDWVNYGTDLSAFTITGDVQVRFTVTGDNSMGGFTYHNDILIDDVEFKETPVSATIVVDSNTTCAGVADGGATVSAINGAAPYTYSWSNGATTASITGIASGSYTVTVTDAGMDTTTAMVTIMNGTQMPVVSLGNDTSICSGASLVLDAGVFSSYSWDDASTMQTRSVSYVLGATDYSVTVTDIDGCAGSDTITVTGYTMPVVDLGNDTTVCDGTTLTLDAGSFTSYLWDDASTMQTRTTVSTLGAVDYSVEVTDANGCTANDTIEVTGAAPVVVDLGNDTALCNGAPYTLDAGAGFTSYFWSNGMAGQTLDVTSTVAGSVTYSVTVEDAAGCTGTDEAIISTKAPVVVDLGPDTNIWVPGTTEITLDAGTGFASYLWSDNITTTQTYVVKQSNSGTVSVVVTDADGCTGTDTVEVNFVLGVSEFSASTLKMYPNPAVDQVTVELSNFGNANNVNVTFLTIEGKVVMTQRINVIGDAYVETFDVSSLATGTYLVQFEANGETVVRKFVIE